MMDITLPLRIHLDIHIRLIAAVALALLLCATAPGAETARPPNIVLIMADDFGYECVGANGCAAYRTPMLDRLASEGVRFEHCYAQPLCTPSRVQLMTGLYNQRNYIRFGLLDPKATTFAHLLKKAGYATCVAGKWQLGGGFEGPAHFGFDDYCLWQLTIRKSRYPNPVIERGGKIIEYTGGEYGPDVVSDHLCAFMERNKDRPFFAYYPMILTHSPFVPTPDSPAYDRKARDEGAGAEKKYFADMVAYCDKMVGKVVNKLEALGLRENTLILFTGDNGTGMGVTTRMKDGSTIAGGKGKPTDAGMRVPLIASWPGKSSGGRVSRDLVDFTDVLPTLMDAAGAETPKGLDGRSFLPQLLGKPGNPRPWTYCWYARDGGPTGVEFARDQRFKLYREGRFYDVSADVLETKPLPADGLSAEAKQARAKLEAALDQFKGTRKLLPNPGKPAKPRKAQVGAN
jgi:arylsulfatase A